MVAYFFLTSIDIFGFLFLFTFFCVFFSLLPINMQINMRDYRRLFVCVCMGMSPSVTSSRSALDQIYYINIFCYLVVINFDIQCLVNVLHACFMFGGCTSTGLCRILNATRLNMSISIRYGSKYISML